MMAPVGCDGDGGKVLGLLQIAGLGVSSQGALFSCAGRGGLQPPVRRAKLTRAQEGGALRSRKHYDFLRTASRSGTLVLISKKQEAC